MVASRPLDAARPSASHLTRIFSIYLVFPIFWLLQVGGLLCTCLSSAVHRYCRGNSQQVQDSGVFSSAFTHNSCVTAWPLHLSGLSFGKQLMCAAHLLFLSQLLARVTRWMEQGSVWQRKFGEICELMVDFSFTATQLKCKTAVISFPGARKRGFPLCLSNFQSSIYFH